MSKTLPKVSPSKKLKKKDDCMVDGINISELPRDDLEILVLKIQDELDKIKEQKTQIQADRDVLQTTCETYNNQLEELKTKLKDVESKELERSERSGDYIQVEKNDVTEMKDELNVILKSAQVEHAKALSDLHKEKKDMQEKLKQHEYNLMEELKNAISIQKQEREALKLEFEETLKKHKTETAAAASSLATANSKVGKVFDIAEVEDRINKQVKTLVETHRRAFEQLKSFYNEQTLKTLDILDALVTEILNLKSHADSTSLSRKGSTNSGTGKHLEGNLQKVLKDLTYVKKRAADAEKVKIPMDFKQRMAEEHEREKGLTNSSQEPKPLSKRRSDTKNKLSNK